MAHEVFLNGKVQLCCGDSLHFLRDQPDNRYDSVMTDPPYALVSIQKRFGSANAAAVKVPEGGSGAYARASAGFMGKKWDNGETAFAVEFWAEVLRVLKPGGHVVAFGGTRTYHRLACAIEDAGFEIRDMLSWLYGSGFPKSHDVSKGIDRTLGAERTKVRIPASELKNPPNLVGGAGKGDDRPWRESAIARGFHEAVSDEAVSDEAVEWLGWGTALKPACEPICLARKPLIGTVATNVLEYGTGALNIVGTRVGTRTASTGEVVGENVAMSGGNYGRVETGETTIGRWPANIIHDGSQEVLSAFPICDSPRANGNPNERTKGTAGMFRAGDGIADYRDTGSAARFFYTAKAGSDDRLGSKHPTVKPVDLMQWLVRLVTPKGGLVLDPFAGTGTTAEACYREGMRCMLIERETDYQADIRRRMTLCMAGPDERRRESIKEKIKGLPQDHGPLFS